MAKSKHKNKILVWEDGAHALLTKNKRLLVRDRAEGGITVFMRKLMTAQQLEEMRQLGLDKAMTGRNYNFKKAGQHVVETEIWLTEETAMNLVQVLYSYLENKHWQRQAERDQTSSGPTDQFNAKKDNP